MRNSLTASPKILVVDDDQELLKLITMLLNRIGAQTIQAKDGVQALAIMQQSVPPDLIILDLMLPDIDGIEILQRIREQPRFAHIPIIILSARASPDSMRHSMEQGANSYITKPYITNNLIERVTELLGESKR